MDVAVVEEALNLFQDQDPNQKNNRRNIWKIQNNVVYLLYEKDSTSYVVYILSPAN